MCVRHAAVSKQDYKTFNFLLQNVARWWAGTHHRIDKWGGHHRSDHVMLDALQQELVAAAAAGEPGATAFR